MAVQVDNGFSDVCDLDNLIIDIEIFDCVDIGLNVVILIVIDIYGNYSICFVLIIVEDNVVLIVFCQDVIV